TGARPDRRGGGMPHEGMGLGGAGAGRGRRRRPDHRLGRPAAAAGRRRHGTGGRRSGPDRAGGGAAGGDTVTVSWIATTIGNDGARTSPSSRRSWGPRVWVATFVGMTMMAAAAWLPARADDSPATRGNALAVLGTPSLPPDFPYFPYVNPNAPKGGEVTLAAVGTYDSFNPFILRGTATGGMVSPWVTLPGGAGSGTSVGHVWESLLTGSADEGAVGYGHLAATVELPADRMWVAFEIRPEARFSDGTPVTAEDVAWTYRTLLTQGRPSFRVQFSDVKDVAVESPRRVVFHFTSNANRQLPLILGGLPVLPAHWFKDRDFTRPLSDPPIGSGPYRIARFELGRSVVYERDPNWWAANFPTGKG